MKHFLTEKSDSEASVHEDDMMILLDYFLRKGNFHELG